jgi:hypothetical protein
MSHYDGDEDFWSSGPAEGYSVCSRCFDDIDISNFIESGADSKECDFCGRKSRTRAIAAPLDAVVEFMAEAINREYDRAVNALSYESAEGGYQGEHFDSRELLADWIGLRLPNDDGRLLDVLVDCFGDEEWCQRDPYGLRPDELLKFSWERFCGFIKNERRYFFLQGQVDGPSDRYLTPSQLLKLVSKAAEEHDLVKTLPAGSLIYRARQQRRGEVLLSPYAFGPPPVECALRSNRMSPAGIVMFYGSEDRGTARAEIDDDPRLGISIGTFRTTRPAAVLDFTALPRRLGFFESQSDSSSVDRYALAFLHSFVKSLAAKVDQTEREHVDYVPTQVVTEYFRTTFRRRDGSVLEGIRYFSTQRELGKSLVLFADRDAVVLKPAEIELLVRSGKYQEWELRLRHRESWLELVRKRVIRPPSP